MTRELRRRRVRLKSAAADSGTIAPRPLRDLREVRAVPVEIKGPVIWVRMQIERNAEEMFRATGVQIPKKPLKFCGKGDLL